MYPLTKTLFTASLAAVAAISSCPASAGQIQGSVETIVKHHAPLSPGSVIEIHPDSEKGTASTWNHAEYFADNLRTKYPNTYVGEGRAPTPADFVVKFVSNSALHNEEGQRTIYRQEPTSWRCSPFLYGYDCNVSSTQRVAVGSRTVEYTFAGYKIISAWYHAAPGDNYRLAFFATAHLVTDVEPGMCSNTESYRLMIQEIINSLDSSSPVDRKFGFRSPKHAGCDGE